MEQELQWDEKTNECMLVTKREDGSLLYEPLTVEQASEWQAANKY